MDKSNTQPIIEIKKLQRIFQIEEVITIALKEASFKINQGELLAIMGPSGSGKSTLMHIVGFLDKATDGEYYFKGKNVTELEEDELADLRNQEVGFVFQSFNLLPRTTVYENVRLPLIYSQIPASDHDELVMKAIRSVGLAHRLEHTSNQLSGGEKQRVAIARALVNNPGIILADEPTGNLDSKSGAQIMRILQDLNKTGKTIIMVTHENEVAQAARRVISMRDGEIANDTKVVHQKIFKAGEVLNK